MTMGDCKHLAWFKFSCHCICCAFFLVMVVLFFGVFFDGCLTISSLIVLKFCEIWNHMKSLQTCSFYFLILGPFDVGFFTSKVAIFKTIIIIVIIK